jgi:hypothetical protein
MHAALLTVLVIAGADPPAFIVAGQSNVSPTAMVSSSGCSECGEAACSDCCSGAAGRCGCHTCPKLCRDWCGPMPQTCYGPRYGCYAGSSRTINRYPAFHGYYQRKPYNYRHYFEYPWHATPHNPQAFYTYQPQVEGQEIRMPMPQTDGMPTEAAPAPAPPKPTSQSSQARLHTRNVATRLR